MTELNIDYEFKNPELLALALTQSGANAKTNNERLEFVGDRVLGLTVAELLYEMFPDESEGHLARRHALLVSTDTLARVAKMVELEKHLRHGHMTGGRLRHILANGMEAIFGAVFIDGGFDAARRIIRDVWSILATQDLTPPKDAKSALQEFVQHHDNGNLPTYEYMAATGVAHAPEFHVRVTAMGQSADGAGASKKDASTNAASALLKILAISDSDV